MKRMLVVFVLLLAVSGGAHSNSSKAYVGLFSDENHSAMSAYGAYTAFELWIWWLPSLNGLKGAGFQVTFPANVVVSSTTTVNPLAYPVECDFFPHGVGCVGFFDCQMDWVWSHHVTCWPLSVEPSLIAIGPPEGEESFLAGNCCCGHPLDTVAVFNMFGVNTIPVIAAEKYSWGSIKGLYR